MKRALWIQPLTEQSWPAWPCPTCAKGSLTLVPNSLVEKQTANSRQTYEVLGEPDLITSTFSAWLKCNYGNCGEEVVVTGNGKVVKVEKEMDDLVDECIEDTRPGPKYGTIYQPIFCWPMPDMFELPDKCPPEVQAELRAGFQLFWSDQAASAGRIRVSLERLMDHYRIPKRRKNRKGKYYDLSLDDRIKDFRNAEPTAGEKLMALKWLGNTGSHKRAVSREDLLDGFEVVEYSIAELFDKRPARVARLARQLIRKHARRRK
jgi:hypothetical protein